MQRTYQEVTRETSDAITLFGVVEAPQDPAAVVVMVHGLCEHLGRFDRTAALLNEAGYATLRFDQRGHGRSGGEVPRYENARQILSDISLFIEQARELFPKTPLFLMGHSLGGFAAAYYGAARPNTVDGFILCAAWTRDEQGTTVVDSTLSDDDLLRYTISPEKRHSPSSGESKTCDPLLRSKFSVSLMRALHEGICWLQAHISDFRDPVLFVHGSNDDLLFPENSLKTCQAVGATDKTLFLYAGLHHMILQEEKGVRVVRDIIEWLNDRTGNRRQS